TRVSSWRSPTSTRSSNARCSPSRGPSCARCRGASARSPWNPSRARCPRCWRRRRAVVTPTVARACWRCVGASAPCCARRGRATRSPAMPSRWRVALLSVEGLVKHFPLGGARAWLDRLGGQAPRSVRAVDGVSFAVAPGETLGLVGESGCGKSTVARSILRLVEPTAGRVIFGDVDLTALSAEPLRRQRRNLQMVFQDPTASLNPRLSVRRTVQEPLQRHTTLGAGERRARVKYMTHRVAVMYLGTIVAEASTAELFTRPLHPYTRALLSAVPVPDPDRRHARIVLAGEVPSPIDILGGCRLRGRCPLAQPVCAEPVTLRAVAPAHRVACHLV